jgi:hypothetical protein
MRTLAQDPAEPSDRYDDKRARLWIGILTAPIAFLTNLQIGYSLADFVCAGKASPAWLHIVPLTLLASSLVVFALCYQVPIDLEHSLGSDRKLERRKFMRHLGMISSSLFALVILMQWIATFYIDPCAK